MGLKIKEGYWDIYSIIFLSTLFTLLVLILPDLELIRIFLGILFLILFPGYVTVSVLWPMKYDSTEEQEEDEEDDLFPEEKEEIRSSKIKKKTIDGPTRLALSIGLSIAITPVIGFIFNELYPINNDIFGLRLIPILLTIYLYIMIVSGIAIWRREKLPRKRRITLSFELKAPFDNTIQDRVITISLITLIIISSGVGVYLYKYYHENEKYTEFYILGPEKRISDYPNTIFINDEKKLYIGINNKEYEDVEYEIRISLKSHRNLTEVTNLNNIVLGMNNGYKFITKLNHNEEFQSPLYFKIIEPGKYDLHFDLIKDNEVYRELFLKLSVFNQGDMIVNESYGCKFYLLSEKGLPGGFPSTMDSNYSLEVQFGVENLRDSDLELNISISSENPQRWYMDMDREFPMIRNTGYYFLINIEPRRSSLSSMTIEIPKGNWILHFNINGVSDDQIIKEIYVH